MEDVLHPRNDLDVDQALADLGEFVPTVFICDLSMPGLDGLNFMRRMRTLPDAHVKPDSTGLSFTMLTRTQWPDF